MSDSRFLPWPESIVTTILLKFCSWLRRFREGGENFKENEKIETSKQIKERVEKAIKMQRERYANMDILYNSELTPKLIERYCKLDNVGNKIMEKAFINYGLTARTYTRILKVARTIADLEGNMKITAKNIAEAIQYRFVN